MNFKLISKRLFLLFVFIFIFSGALKTAYNHYIAYEHENEFVLRQAKTLNSFMLVHRDYYQKLYLDKTILLNEKTVLGLPAYSARDISKQFSHQNSFNMTIKTVSDRARNALNQADNFELKAINSFKSDRTLQDYLMKEENYYQYATPLFIEAKCLSCHGKREEAPSFISENYDKAYNYKLGELRGIISIKIPIAEVNQYFISQFYQSLIFDLLLVLVISLFTAYIVRNLKFLNEKLEEEITSRTYELQENIAFFESYKMAIDKSSIVTKSDMNGIITYANDNFVSVSGYTYKEIIGKTHNIIRHSDTPDTFFKQFYLKINANKIWKGIIKNRNKNGEDFWVDMVVTPITNAFGETVEYIAVRHDITELMHQREILEKNAYTDSLTGLSNRVKLLQLLPTIERPVIALFDIDNFSQTNDFYGSKIGDKLIIQLSETLSNMMEGEVNSHIFRLNGDEFVILNAQKEKRLFIEEITLILKTIHASASIIDNNEIPLDVSVGISFEIPSLLLSTADIALKHAKKTNKSLIVYNPSLSIEKSYEKNMFWSKELKKAIKNNKLLPYYQPIINNHTGKVEKYESLIRLIDEHDKVISPFFFLEVAKQSKQYHYITQIVIDKAFETFASLDYEFSINLTIEDILDKQIQQYLFTALSQYNIGSRLVFEIVEDEGIENFNEINEFIIAVKEYGCKIAIDDFGTGYSNFEYLIKLKADFIKIDGSMIKNLESDENSRILVSTIVVFAKKLGMKTIAEFVKDEKIQNLVLELGVDYSQGYYFGEPKPTPILGE
ncbi:MAG: EAL domain-containing protein [Campylobacterota bacterium]|nr:EAL domain-containing protein [Campylobacterota bacterium]